MGLRLAGPGVAWGVPASGATPVNFAGLKEMTLDFDLGVKGENGGNVVAFDFMRGEMKLTGKAKVSGLSVALIAALIMGVTPASGSTLTQYLEAASIPAMTTYTVTVANGATFVQDLEVLYQLTGLPLAKVSSAPAAGQYSVNMATGVFTFAAADAGKGVLISYNYTATGGYSLSWNNTLQGDAPIFGMTFYNKKNGYPVNYTFPYCTSSKFSRGFKGNDFMNPEIDIMIGANAAGLILIENYPILV